MMTENKRLMENPSPNGGTPMAESYVGSALQFLGGLAAIDKLKEHLSSQVMVALMTIEEQKLYEHYGYRTFKDFLEGASLSKMSKSQFYRLRELYLKEGPEQYDLFTNWKVPLKTRRLLESGDVTIDGDEVVIGGEERVSLANSGSVKAIIEQLVKEKHQATSDFAECMNTISRQQTKLDAAGVEKERLEAEIQAMTEPTAYEAALANLLTAFMNLGSVVECMDPKDREERAAPDLRTFSFHLQELEASYGVADWQLKMRELEAATAGGQQ